MKDVSNMSREELLGNINNTLGLLNKFRQIDYHIKSYYKSPPSINEKISVIATIIMIIPVTMIVFQIFKLITGGFFLLEIISFPFGAGISFFLGRYINKKMDENFQRKQDIYLEENEETLEELHVELGQVAEEVYLTTVVPEDYVNEEALEKFSIYLSNYRASTLPECINLYETELQAQQMRDEINYLRQEQQVTNQMLSEARSELSTTNRHLREVNVSLNSIHHEAYKNNFHK